MTKLLDMYEPKGSDLIAQSISKLADNFQTIKGLYPVGKIWISRDPTSPDTIIGGHWEYIQARVLMSQGNAGSGEEFKAGETGGTVTHRHLIPFGFNTQTVYGFMDSNGSPYYGSITHPYQPSITLGPPYTNQPSQINIAYTAHEWHMPPYYVVYMWERKS